MWLWALAAFTLVSLGAWVYLAFLRGFFWRIQPMLRAADAGADGTLPRVAVVVPARNEAHTLPETLPALLTQDYPGEYRVFLVDDHSDDGTSDVATRLATESGEAPRLEVIRAGPLPRGWTGRGPCPKHSQPSTGWTKTCACRIKPPRD